MVSSTSTRRGGKMAPAEQPTELFLNQVPAFPLQEITHFSLRWLNPDYIPDFRMKEEGTIGSGGREHPEYLLTAKTSQLFIIFSDSNLSKETDLCVWWKLKMGSTLIKSTENLQ